MFKIRIVFGTSSCFASSMRFVQVLSLLILSIQFVPLPAQVLSPMAKASAGNKFIDMDPFSSLFDSKEKDTELGFYFGHPYFRSDLSTFSIIGDIDLGALSLSPGIQYLGFVDFKEWLYRMRFRLRSSRLILAADLNYLHRRIVKYTSRKSFVGELALSYRLDPNWQTIGTIQFLTPLYDTRLNSWNTSIGIAYSSGKDLKFMAIYEFERHARPVIIASIHYQWKNDFLFQAGYCYNRGTAGFGISKMTKSLSISIGLSYHEYLGSGHSSGFNYRIKKT